MQAECDRGDKGLGYVRGVINAGEEGGEGEGGT